MDFNGGGKKSKPDTKTTLQIFNFVFQGLGVKELEEKDLENFLKWDKAGLILRNSWTIFGQFFSSKDRDVAYA